MTSSLDDEHQRILDASQTIPFRFEQGSSLHVGILGMVGRPSGAHDEAPFASGSWASGRSQVELDLSELQAPHEETTAVRLWFEADRTALDISAAFEGVPAEAMQGSGIPPAVLNGPVMVDRTGDAGDGIAALLTQMCAGKLVVDPHGLLDVLASEHLEAFQEHHVENSAPMRAYNAAMSIQTFLQSVGLTRTALINQIAVLGYDLRHELGAIAIEALDDYLKASKVQLAWLVDERGRVTTAQAVVVLTDFLGELFSNDHVVAQLADEEDITAQDMAAFVASSAEAGRLVYVNAMWQKFVFAETDEVVNVVWPDAVDLSVDVAAQASRLRSGAAPSGTASGSVTVDPGMLEAMAASSGAMHFVLTAVEGDAVAAMHAAQAAIMAVRHPDEPDESLASFLSDVVERADGAQFWADISHLEEAPEVLAEVLAVVTRAVRTVVTRAHLSSNDDL